MSQRRGTCPTLAAPMATGDGLLARLNPISGGLTPANLAAIGEAASRFGNGLLEVTARGSLQIRGLMPDGAPKLAATVDTMDIAVRVGVPVETGPLAGLDPQETGDATGLSGSIRKLIAKAGLARRLGPKVSVIVDGGGQLNLNAIPADVRLEAVAVDMVLFWRVAIGGTSATARVLGLAPETDVCNVTIALLEAVASKGRAARAKDLQVEALLSSLPPFAPPGSAGGGIIEQSPIGTFLLSGTRVAVGLGLPFGQVVAAQVTQLAEAARRHGILEIRLAPGRALLALSPTSEAASSVKEAAGALGFITDPADPRLCVVACAGAPACASGYLPARQVASGIAAEAASVLARGQLLHVSGCAKQCARPTRAAFTLIGTRHGAELHAGDGTAGHAIVRVANDAAADAFRRAGEFQRQEKNERDKVAATS